MKIHRFIGNFDTKQGAFVIKDPALVDQVGKVLKLASGEKILLGDGRGLETVCVIEGIKKGELKLIECERQTNENESEYTTVLCLALLKKDNFELAVQKAVEVGVSEIIPITTERTVKLGFARERLEKIIKEAAEQSGRGIVPHLEDPIPLENALFHANRKGTVLFCDMGEYASPSEIKTKGASYLFIGPEGGWSDAEREMAREADGQFVALAKTTLRAETAAIVASYLFSSYL